MYISVVLILMVVVSNEVTGMFSVSFVKEAKSATMNIFRIFSIFFLNHL